MRFLIIIPAHNEENHIIFTLQSLDNQEYNNFECIVVDDGSSDRTATIVGDFIKKSSYKEQFSLITLPPSAHQPGAKVVRTFYSGYDSADISKFDIICKFDADIIFPKNYLQELNNFYENNPKAGMVSGLVRILKPKIDAGEPFNFSNENGAWVFENLSSDKHIRGPIKSYRVQCFRDIGGLRPVLGWDNIDVMLARKYGWEVATIKYLWVKHLRPTAGNYKAQKAQKLGEYFYNIGLNAPLAALSSAKSSIKNKSVREFFTTMHSFLSQKHPRQLSREEIAYIRNLRWKSIFKK